MRSLLIRGVLVINGCFLGRLSSLCHVFVLEATFGGDSRVKLHGKMERE